jgi:putative flippase GtrA
MSTKPTTDAPATSLFARIWQQVLVYALKFGAVGLVGFAVDLGLFNLLILGAGGEGWWTHPVGAKFLSTCAAILVNWIGNRYWTFRNDRHRHVAREFVEFVTASLAGMAVTLAFVWFTYDVLGFQSVLASNISANVIGLALGTLVRFVLYRFWVWGYRPGEVGEPHLTSATGTATTTVKVRR